MSSSACRTAPWTVFTTFLYTDVTWGYGPGRAQCPPTAAPPGLARHRELRCWGEAKQSGEKVCGEAPQPGSHRHFHCVWRLSSGARNASSQERASSEGRFACRQFQANDRLSIRRSFLEPSSSYPDNWSSTPVRRSVNFIVQIPKTRTLFLGSTIFSKTMWSMYLKFYLLLQKHSVAERDGQ